MDKVPETVPEKTDEQLVDDLWAACTQLGMYDSGRVLSPALDLYSKEAMRRRGALLDRMRQLRAGKA